MTMRTGLLGGAFGAVMLAGLAFALRPADAGDTARVMPPPAMDVPAGQPGLQTAVFSGGCFWGVQGVFEHVRGVTQALSGYTGGSVAYPDYEQVSTGDTGDAESVRVTFDPAQVSYGKLLQIFFSVALNPTQVNEQGPDVGTQYRSELFVNGPGQGRVARAYIAQLTAAHVFSRPIATRVDPAGAFYPAEAYHQNYLVLHPDAPYIAFNDMPKVRNLKHDFPQNWQRDPVMVGKPGSAS